MPESAAKVVPSTQAPESDRRFRVIVHDTDRDAVRSIVERTGFFRPDEADVAVELVDEHLSRGLASGYNFVFAEVKDRVVGYACYGPIACTLASFDLYWIAVDPEFQGQGLGRAVLRAAESQIVTTGGDRIYVDTSGQAKYCSTRRFYERQGFRCEARLVDFYAPGDDRIIYTKAIGPQRV
jgi:ribosomal protein S18 acetylase RimI-like enzyme